MADPTNKVPFPLLGTPSAPATLRFRTRDLIELETKYGLEFTSEVSSRILGNSSECMVFCLRAGLKDAEGKKPFKGVDFDDLPFAVQEAAGEILDAISIAITGQSYAELAERRREAEANPLPDLEKADSSSELSGSDTPTGS